MYGYSKAARIVAAVLFCLLGITSATETFAQQQPVVTGRIDWGIWLDRDGCQHWYSDGGLEGYMVERVRPKDGKPVCVKIDTCLVANTDTMFATDSARLTTSGAERLRQFFSGAGAYGYAIYGHTDARASDEYNMSLSSRRAAAVASVARSVGAVVEREQGFGERQPRASNDTAKGMAQNRRVEVVCYRW